MTEQLTADHGDGGRRAVAVQRGWFAALAVALVLSLGVFVAMMLINGQRLDEGAKQASIATMQEGIDERADQLDRVVKDHAWWNEAVDAIQLRQDREWAGARLGPYLYGTYRYDWAFVIAPDGSAFFAGHDGDTVADDITKVLGNDLWRPLVERSRSAVADGEPQAVHAFLRMRDGGLGIGSAAAIMPETSWSMALPAGTPYVLVLVRGLDANWFAELARALGLRNLTFSLRTVSPATGLQLAGPDGKHVGSVSWQTRRPGTEYLIALVPTLAVVLMLLLAFMWLAFQSGRAAPR